MKRLKSIGFFMVLIVMAVSVETKVQASSFKMRNIISQSVDPKFDDYEGGQAFFDERELSFVYSKIVNTKNGTFLVLDKNDKIKSSTIECYGTIDEMVEVTLVTNVGMGKVQEWFVIFQEENGKYKPWYVQKASSPICYGEDSVISSYSGCEGDQEFDLKKVGKNIWKLKEI